MNSKQLGETTLGAEVTNVSRHGIWVLLGNEEHFLPFTEFPWFASARVEELFDLETPHPGHLFWPKLDVDLSIDSVRHPEHYPKIAKH